MANSAKQGLFVVLVIGLILLVFLTATTEARSSGDGHRQLLASAEQVLEAESREVWVTRVRVIEDSGPSGVSHVVASLYGGAKSRAGSFVMTLWSRRAEFGGESHWVPGTQDWTIHDRVSGSDLHDGSVRTLSLSGGGATPVLSIAEPTEGNLRRLEVSPHEPGAIFRGYVQGDHASVLEIFARLQADAVEINRTHLDNGSSDDDRTELLARTEGGRYRLVLDGRSRIVEIGVVREGSDLFYGRPLVDIWHSDLETEDRAKASEVARWEFRALISHGINADGQVSASADVTSVAKFIGGQRQLRQKLEMSIWHGPVPNLSSMVPEGTPVKELSGRTQLPLTWRDGGIVVDQAKAHLESVRRLIVERGASTSSDRSMSLLVWATTAGALCVAAAGLWMFRQRLAHGRATR